DFHVTGVQTCALPICRDRASSDGRAPLVASLLESARTKGRKMLCASPDHQLVHVQAAVCGPQNRQYQTSGTTCRIRGENKLRIAIRRPPRSRPFGRLAPRPLPAGDAEPLEEQNLALLTGFRHA